MAYQGNYPKLRIASDILFKSFWIGMGLIIVFWIIYMMGYQAWAMKVLGIGHKEMLEPMILVFFAMAKFVLIFYALVPALAIRWAICKLEKKLY